MRRKKVAYRLKRKKLTRSKFKGTYSSQMTQVLQQNKETLVVRLPFTAELYERAETIIKSKYGKDGEAANSHIQSLIALSKTHYSNPQKASQFYEKLVTYLQAVSTFAKFSEIKGYAQ